MIEHFLPVFHERDHGYVEPETASQACEEQQSASASAPAKEEDRAPKAAGDVVNGPRFPL